MLKKEIDRISDGGGTFIGCGLQMGINLLNSRQTTNPLSALFLLTDGQDNEQHDYSQLMKTLPQGVLCHTFGYGPDHTASLLVQLADQGNGGTFTYIVSSMTIHLPLKILSFEIGSSGSSWSRFCYDFGWVIHLYCTTTSCQYSTEWIIQNDTYPFEIFSRTSTITFE